MKAPSPTNPSPRPGFLGEGLHELGRKFRRAKIRRAIATNRRKHGEQLTQIGEKAWSVGLELPDAGDLRARLTEVDDRQSGVASQEASIDEERKQLEQEKADAVAGFDERRKELTRERQQKRQRLKAAAEDEKAQLESTVTELGGKLAELARERKETLAPLDKRLSESRKAAAGARKEGAALVREKKDLFSRLGQAIIEGGVKDPSLEDDLANLEKIEAGRAVMEEELADLQAVSDAIAPGVMAKFYGLGAAVLVVPILFLGAVWWLVLSDRPSVASRPSRDVASTTEREGRQRTEESRASQPSISSEEVDELVQALQRGSVDERVEAGQALGEAGTGAVAALIELLGDRSDDNRADAAYALAEMDELPREQAREVVNELVGALEDQNWRVRANAAVALGNLGRGSSDAWAALADAVEDPEPRVRGAAAYALGEIEVRSSESVPILAQRLREDEVPDVRVLAANGLGMLDHEEAVPALVAGLQDENWEVQYASFRALGTLEDKAVGALPALIDLLPRLQPERATMVAKSVQMIVEEAGPRYRPSSELNEALVQRIGIIVRSTTLTSQREGAPIAEALPTIVAWTPSATTQIALELAPLLWEAGGEAEFMAELVLPALLAIAQVRRESASELIPKLQERERNVRWAAASALGAMRSERAVPGLIRVLDDEDPGVQHAAAQSLARFGSAARVPLSEALRHENPSVRVHAAYALAEIGRDVDDEAVVAALSNALQDDEFIVREAVACALKNVQQVADCDPDGLLGLTGR